MLSRVFILGLLLLGATLTAVLPGHGGAVLCIAADHVTYGSAGHHDHDHAGSHDHGTAFDRAGHTAHACPDHAAGCVDLALPGLTLQRASDPAEPAGAAAHAIAASETPNLAARRVPALTAWRGRPPPPHLAPLGSVRLLI